MSKNKLLHLLSVSTLIVFVLSAVLTVPAMADSGSTPPPNGSTSGGRTSNKGSSSNSLSQVPAGTKIVVVDASGNKLPLGSQAAQDIVTSGDPIWCPSTVASPVAGVSGCSPAFYNGNLYDLTYAVENHLWTPTATNSTIWILGGADSSGFSSYLNGSALGALSNFTLTLAGGWTGSGHSVNTGNPSVLDGGYSNNVTIDIENWHNNVTLSNIEVEESTGYGVYLYGNSKNLVLTNIQANNNYYQGGYIYGPAGTGVTITNSTFNSNDQALGSYDGLDIYSAGAVTLTDTTASNNYYYGAYIDTADYGTANVTLTGTNIFDSNTTQGGLDVYSKGTITSGSLDANYNGAFGADLINSGASSALPVTLSGTSSFSGNGSDGLRMDSQGAITVNNVTALGNGSSYGAKLENNYNFNSKISVTGTNNFSGNATYGLIVDSYGAISINNITANTNTSEDGLYAQNYSAGKAENITLTGLNSFNNNGWNGAELYATGAVSLSNVTADLNSGSSGIAPYGDGVFIQNDYLGPQSVSLLGTNAMSLNHTDGLAVETFGAISINNLTANFNSHGDGANLWYNVLDSTGAVTLSGVNTFNYDNQVGLVVYSKGKVTLSNVTADFTGVGDGADLYNDNGITPQSVTLTGTNTFSFNHFNGLWLNSDGAITVNNLTAENNTGSGVTLDNCLNTAGCTNTHFEPITLTGTNAFNFNHYNGLFVSATGAISASNLNASFNTNSSGNWGVVLTNCAWNGSNCTGPASSANVTVSGTNSFNDNTYGYGLIIESTGSVTTNNLTAVNDGTSSAYNGVEIDNSLATTTSKTVTLTGVNVFNNDGEDGVYVDSRGAISAANVTANNNWNEGAYLYNQNTGSTGGISLTGTNTILYNEANGGNYGIDMYSYGAESITHVTADFNSEAGLWFSTPGKVTVTCGTFVGNGTTHIDGYGWETDFIYAPSSITLIGTDYAGNYDAPYAIDGSTSSYLVPRTCTLP